MALKRHLLQDCLFYYNVITLFFGGCSMSQNGKGSAPRKKQVSNKVWAKNWDMIFGKKKKKSDKS
jgi:hypothetical protein